jgi:2-dehydro-3-deoxygalactonokinase
MIENVAARLIALDWGTSSLRAYLLGGDGEIIARADEPQGILQVKDGNFADVYRRIVGPWLARNPAMPALGCGMIGSRQGWREAPYAACPAGLDALAAALTPVDTPVGVFRIVSGMNVIDADGVPDVMRGEESQILGQFGPGQSGVAVLPGTHSKWVLVENGRIDRFATFMTGEAFAA